MYEDMCIEMKSKAKLCRGENTGSNSKNNNNNVKNQPCHLVAL